MSVLSAILVLVVAAVTRKVVIIIHSLLASFESSCELLSIFRLQGTMKSGQRGPLLVWHSA